MRKKIILISLVALYQTNVVRGFNQKSLALLNSPFIFQAPTKNLPPDISYIFADLKFDSERLQLCELGPCPYAGLTTAPMFVGNHKIMLTSPYIDLFWHHLSQFNIPIVRIGGWDPVDATKVLSSLGGKRIKSFHEYLNTHSNKNSIKQKIPSLPCISQASEIVVCTRQCTEVKNYTSYIQAHPDIIFVNQHIEKFISKNHTNTLCKDAQLIHYKPHNMTIPAVYTPMLAQSIINTFNVPFYIIKPTYSLRGRGIIMTAQDELDATLKALFCKDSTSKTTVPKASFWKCGKQKECIIEAYAASKKVRYNDTWYDPTMRLVCFLMHNCGTITINVIGGYWKTPRYGLYTKYPLTLKHITEAGVGERFAIATHDLVIVQKLCAELMYDLYSAVLKRNVTKEK